MSQDLVPSLFPWFAPLPGPLIMHLRQRIERTQKTGPDTSLHLLFESVKEKRAATYFYMEPFVQARIEGGPPALSFSTGWLLKTLGAQSPRKKSPVSQKTLSYWRSKGLIRFQQHGLPEYAGAAAIYIARLIDAKAERNFLPPHMTPDEQDWWCFTQEAPGAPILPWQVSQLHTLPPATFCWTPWPGAAWEAGWLRRQDSSVAMRWAGVAQDKPLAYNLTPEDIASWNPGKVWTMDLNDPDILQTSAALTLYQLANQAKKLMESAALKELSIPLMQDAIAMEEAKHVRLRS